MKRLAEPIVAYRAWMVTETVATQPYPDAYFATFPPKPPSQGRPVLTSFKAWGLPLHACIWEPGKPLEAQCLCVVAPTGRHSPPQPHGHCGIYAMKDLMRLIEGPMAHFVWGAVLLSGRVIEHEHGYRAERAQVAALFSRPAARISPSPGHLARLYGVPLVPTSERDTIQPHLPERLTIP